MKHIISKQLELVKWLRELDRDTGAFGIEWHWPPNTALKKVCGHAACKKLAGPAPKMDLRNQSYAYNKSWDHGRPPWLRILVQMSLPVPSWTNMSENSKIECYKFEPFTICLDLEIPFLTRSFKFFLFFVWVSCLIAKLVKFDRSNGDSTYLWKCQYYQFCVFVKTQTQNVDYVVSHLYHH